MPLAEDDGYCGALPQNKDTVEAFYVAQTQWRYSQGIRTGLDYPACKLALDAEGMDFRAVFAGLRVMEHEILSSTKLSDDGASA